MGVRWLCVCVWGGGGGGERGVAVAYGLYYVYGFFTTSYEYILMGLRLLATILLGLTFWISEGTTFDVRMSSIETDL